MTNTIQTIGPPPPKGPVLPEAFDQFVGDTFFRQMLKSLRSTTGKPAYFHGGQAEEIFQSQLDELLITDMAKATKESFSADLVKQQFPDHAPPENKQPGQQPLTTNSKQQTPTALNPVNSAEHESNFDKNA
ncbi:MAG: rod-binding protein [Planctomycetota bacterium]|nr:rod-binding protein [Planctomycetota bacterium]